MKEAALGKREFLKVGLKLINIQGASPLSLKFVAPIFHPVYLITQAEPEPCGCGLEHNAPICNLPGYGGGCRGYRGTVEVRGQNLVTSVVMQDVHSQLAEEYRAILNHYPSVWLLTYSSELHFIFLVLYRSKSLWMFPW